MKGGTNCGERHGCMTNPCGRDHPESSYTTNCTENGQKCKYCCCYK